jgi:DNA-binding beta-propeller fold protein YncE
MRSLFRTCLFGFAIQLAFICSSVGQEVYYTSEPGESINLLNLSTHVNQKLLSTASISGKLDSLILNAQGQLIYSIPGLGQIWLFDPVTLSNTLLVGGISYPRDMVIEPGGTTMLISLNAQGKIARYNFMTGAVTLLSKNLGSTDGIVYAPNGDLYVVVARNTVCQMDPVLGTKIKCITLEPHYKTNGGDGMVYDPYSGQLWVSHDGTLGNGLIEIPLDLSTFTLFQTGKIAVPDGIVSDAKGNLYIGAGLSNVVVYNIPTDTIVKTVKAPGIDDLVLVPGTF